jgi:hypothetical protein
MDAMLAAMFIPLSAGLTLLDRPLVEMALFIPLAFLAGLGASRVPKNMMVFLAAIIVIYAFSTQEFLPSSCCQLAGPDDVVALDWIKKNLPEDAIVGISSADVTVTSGESLIRGTGTDGGIWIEPLAGKKVILLPYSSDFQSLETLRWLCGHGVTDLYVGGNAMSFQLEPSAWYRPVFSLPSARVLEIEQCSG